MASYAISTSRPEEAVELLEEARDVFWSQALLLRDPDLDMLPPDLAKELEWLFDSLRTQEENTYPVGDSTESTLVRRHQREERLQTVLHQVRRIPGLKHFMLGKPFASLIKAAEKGPVVVLTSNGDVTTAIIPMNSSGFAICLLISKDINSVVNDLAIEVQSADVIRRSARGEATKTGRGFNISYPSPKAHTMESLLAEL